MSEINEHGVEEASREAGGTADDLGDRGERLGDQIEETRRGWDQSKTDDDVPTASSDWDEGEPDESGDDADPAGFDDPENLDLDDEDLTNDEYAEDEEENY